MIPLSRWLSDREKEPQFTFSSDTENIEPASLLPAPELEVEPAVSARELELEDALRTAEETLLSERYANGQNIQRLREELGRELITTLTAQVELSLKTMQCELEAAISDILHPFLRRQSITKASSALMELISAELRNQNEPLLEVRAPGELHDLMRPVLQQLRVSASLSEGQGIELTFPARTARFEQLASRWHDIIAEPVT